MSAAQPPGLLRRMAAIGYDALIVAATLIAATAALLPFTGGEPIAAGSVWYQLLLGGIVIVYFAVSWWRGGRTVGMVAWRLRLRAADGGKPSLLRCLMRAGVAVFSWLAAGMGFFWVLIDRRGRGWHDLLSGTELVFEKPLSARAPAPQR